MPVIGNMANKDSRALKAAMQAQAIQTMHRCTQLASGTASAAVSQTTERSWSGADQSHSGSAQGTETGTTCLERVLLQAQA